ncbi:MAG: hypothetical protein ACKOYJ_06930 [Planctomycetia bacterium]
MSQSPTIAFVAAPKPFQGHTGIIQRNALRSWRALGENIEIVLGGTVDGLDLIGNEIGAIAIGELTSGTDGPPRVDELFSKARGASSADLLAYINSDIILLPDWLQAVRTTAAALSEEFLIIGRRIDTDISHEIDWHRPDTAALVASHARKQGRLAARVCKDYFVFPRDSYQHVPAFRLGRAFWDNWMVHDAHARRVPVVDVTAAATAVHQNHDYGHVPGGRLAAYLTSDGARGNRRLAGGSRMISGAVASWRLDRLGKIRRRRLPFFVSFMLDVHRFVGLTADVVGLKARRRPLRDVISPED